MATPFEKLKAMTAAAAEPTLSNAELEALLAQYAIADGTGATPEAPEWVPTYRLKAAAAEGWRWKAAKASELISTDLDHDRMSSHQIFEHCERMVKLFSRGSTTVSTARYECSDD